MRKRRNLRQTQLKRRRVSPACRFESLERRYVLDSTVVFNEIMYNPAGDTDAALEFIELYNQMSVSIDLSGWTLRGGVNYTFPGNTVLTGGSYLVIGADPAALAATTGVDAPLGPFTGQLSNGGELIQLVNHADRVMNEIEYGDRAPWPVGPDGSGASLAKRVRDTATETTANWVTSAEVGGTPGRVNFANDDNAPPVFTDLLTRNDLATYQIPIDDSLGQAWTEPNFDDAAWPTGTLGIGFDTDAVTENPPDPGSLQAYFTFEGDWDDVAGGHNGIPTGTTFSMDTVSGEGTSLSLDGNDFVSVLLDVSEASYTSSLWFKTTTSGRGLLSVVDSDLGVGGHDRHVFLNGTNMAARTWSNETISSSARNFADGMWHHVVHTFGGSIGGQRIYVDGALVASGNKANSDFHWQQRVNIGFSNDAANDYFNGLIDDVAIWSAAPSPQAIAALYACTSPPELMGFGKFIGTDVEPPMKDVNATVYLRTEFEASPAIYDQLTLHLNYDDGFVAYLNGTQVAESNAPALPAWNSPATSERPDREAVVAAAFDFTPHLGLLREGTNVLAIQGLNLSAADPDFLLLPELSARIAQVQPFAADLALSEISPAGDPDFSLELLNFGTTPIALDDMTLVSSEGAGVQAALPDQLLPPGEFLTLTAATLGFAPQVGDKLFLYSPGQTSVLDAAVVEDRQLGRLPDGTGDWYYPETVTDNAANQIQLHDQIVINEIMYHVAPQYAQDVVPFEERPEEWIEFYNRGTEAIDLTGWRLAGGTSYSFPAETLAPGEYIVVAHDAASLAARFPAARIVGNMAGTLSNNEDTIRLFDANGNLADEVHYHDGGRWSEFADGGGTSLELRDPDGDNSKPEAWSASDESSRSQWQHYSYTDTVTAFPFDPPIHFQEFILGMLDSGEVLLDNVSVIHDPAGAGTELIQNGTFETDAFGSPASNWRIQGTHGRSLVVEDPDAPGNHVLHLIADGKAHYMSNHAETTLAGGAQTVNGQTYQISFDAKWLAGSPQLRSELYHKDAALTTILAQPALSGTPGQQNSAFVPNLGPTYAGLAHHPAVPTSADDITITVQAQDPDGLSTVDLRYAVNGVAPFATAGMTLIGDRYTATIPAQANDTLVQFFIEATDLLGATTAFPAAGPDSRALFKVDDSFALDAVRHDVQILMIPADVTQLHLNTNMMNNNRYGSTVVYDGVEVFYDVGTRLKGSMFTRNSMSGTAYNLKFRPEQKFRGEHEAITIDQKTEQESAVKQRANRLGLMGAMYDDVVMLTTPSGLGGGPTTLQLARHGDVFLDEQFVNGSEGTVYKFEGIRVMQTTVDGHPESLKIYQPIGWVGNFDIQDLGDDKELYRWPYLTLNNRASDDYTRIMDMAKAMSLSGQALQDAVAEVLDADQWMQTFALLSLAGIGDAYTQGNPHNLNFYVRPEDSKVLAFPWDWDFAFNRSTTAALHGGSNLGRVMDLPAYERLLYGHMLHMIDTSFNAAYFTDWSNHYASLLGTNFSSHPTYVTNRGNHVVNAIHADFPAVPYAITSPNPLAVASAQATVEGTGWVDVREIRLAGSTIPLEVRWRTAAGPHADTWEATIPVAFGQHDYTFEAYDFSGDLIGAQTIAIDSGVQDRPHEQYLRVTELNYNPHDALPQFGDANAGNDDFEFLEIANTGPDPLDLNGVRLIEVDVAGDQQGVVFQFAAQTIAPGERLVVVRDVQAFQSRYGGSVRIAAGNDGLGGIEGEYDGRLSNSGERITLLAPSGAIIQQFDYRDSASWPGRADGNGSSLEAVDVNGDFDDPANWRNSTEFGGSPGVAGSGPVVDVVVNEVLTHTDPPLVDSIELYNTTASAIEIGNWYLSDSNADYFKYQISSSTLLAGDAYVVFDETQFNSAAAATPFALNSSNGDDVWLVAADASGKPTRFVDRVSFGAARNGESFGRWPNGSGELYPMLSRTFGGHNSGPRVGPVIVSEVMYHAPDPDGPGGMDPGNLEFVEIFNPTNDAVPLNEWRLRGGIDFDFDATSTLSPQAVIVIVRFDPLDQDLAGDFRAVYGIDQTVMLLGPYAGRLSNGGDLVRLERPDEPPPDDLGFIPRLLEDEADFDDELPWPLQPDGQGPSLTRKLPAAWGNDPTSWVPDPPTPGRVSDGSADVVGRYLFYNRSQFDGNNPLATVEDDNAVALDKFALLPGVTAGYRNYSNYSRGLNGIMIDIANLPLGTLTTDDFTFRIGNDNSPSLWTVRQLDHPVEVRSGEGLGGSDRITILWDDGEIQDAWLQVTVKATSNTGLNTDDVFYFGNAIGDTGDSVLQAMVNGFDFAGVRDNSGTATITNSFDLNRDQWVDGADLALVRDHPTHFHNALNTITPAGTAPPPPAAALSDLVLWDVIEELERKRRRWTE